MLDEYCARYGVRGCYRHLCYLADLLDRAEKHIMIDPTLIHYSFAFCASHVHGNRPDGVGSITHEEKERFQNIKERLRVLLEHQITNFRYFFFIIMHYIFGFVLLLICLQKIQILFPIWKARRCTKGHAFITRTSSYERYRNTGTARGSTFNDKEEFRDCRPS